MKHALAVLAGYATLFVIVAAVFGGAYAWLGPERTFEPGSYAPSTAWIALSLGVGLVAAVLGGFVCARVARAERPVRTLALALLVIGVAFAIFEGKKPDPGPRTGEVSQSEAMQRARQPAWLAWTQPVLGALGVLAGGRLGRRRP